MTRPKNIKIAIVLVAGGTGTRALSPDGSGLAKQLRQVRGRPLISWTLDPLLRHERITVIQPVVHRDHAEAFAAIAPTSPKLRPAVVGGGSRQASTLAGLEALTADAPDIVLIHDAARPFVSADIIDAVIDAIEDGADGAAPGHAVSDTLRRTEGGGAGGIRLGESVSRDHLLALQTPQGFRFEKILQAHRAASDMGAGTATDDTTLASSYGHDVVAVSGRGDNFKVTFAEDFDRMEALLAASQAWEIRTGQGFDVHRLGPGTDITLCGVTLPHDRSLIGHSDADVGLHALTDAIFGALADGDIGAHFPPSDPRWRAAASDRFLAFARDRVHQRGGTITHADVTLICEHPKIGPHRRAMRARIADILEIGVGRVGVKATTSEGLGFSGRGEGIACLATATIRLPAEDA